MLWLVLATLGPAAYFLRRLPSIGPVRAPFGRTIDRLDTGGAVTAFVVFVASAVLYGWSLGTLWGDARGDDGGSWQWVGLVLVALATLLGIAYALLLPERLACGSATPAQLLELRPVSVAA